jgi:hypothetical protein
MSLHNSADDDLWKELLDDTRVSIGKSIVKGVTALAFWIDSKRTMNESYWRVSHVDPRGLILATSR